MSLLRGLWDAPLYSLRGTLLKFSVVSLALAGWTAVTGTINGVLGGMAAGVVLLALGLSAQSRAERTGRAERDRIRQREHRAELARWSWWQWGLVIVALVAVTIIKIVTR